MNWLTNFVKPKLSALVGHRKNVPDNLWKNCPKCGNMIHHKDLYENLHVCNSCNYHFRISVMQRIEILFGSENFKEIELEKTNDDPLNFTDKKKYKDRLKEYRKKTNRHDAFVPRGPALVESAVDRGGSDQGREGGRRAPVLREDLANDRVAIWSWQGPSRCHCTG